MNRILLGLGLLLAMAIGAGAGVTLEDGEVIELAVKGPPPEFTREYDLTLLVIGGSIQIPNVGLVKAVGITTDDLSNAIAKELRERKIFTNPQVVVTLYHGTSILVWGGVQNPNRQAYFRGMTLTQALPAAGPDHWGQAKVHLIRKGQVTEYSRLAIRKGAKDPELLPGDSIELEGEF